MVTKKEKERMQEFVTGLIEESEDYNILSADNSAITLEFKEGNLRLFLHNSKMPVKDYFAALNKAKEEVDYISNIFYKDGINFMVRLAESANARNHKSLKEYENEELNKMINLRALEKEVLKMQDSDDRRYPSSKLVYFQPETERLEESLRMYKMLPVFLDYSHIDRFHRSHGFAKGSKRSIDYRIAEEVSPVEAPLEFKQSKPESKVLVVSGQGNL